jgi:hypothetical protein
MASGPKLQRQCPVDDDGVDFRHKWRRVRYRTHETEIQLMVPLHATFVIFETSWAGPWETSGKIMRSLEYAI